MTNLLRAVILMAIVTAFGGTSVPAQQHPNSPVLKSYVPSDKHSLVTPNDLTYELWQEFMIVRKANEGDPVAQHELGIRYISGKGFSADTTKAAYWIGKAADRGLPSAHYNLGILQNNGWGIAWNPFEAFRNIEFAASHGMPEAEYALGAMYLDNLIVPRDESEAYCLVHSAADSLYEPAEESLMLMEQRGIGTKGSKTAGRQKTSSTTSSPSPNSGVMFLDFDRDTSTHVQDTTLIRELVRDGSAELKQLNDSSTSVKDSGWVVPLIREAAEAGSPEALTILGRWYESGMYVGKDTIAASLCYLRATRFDSPRAPALLWNLSRDPHYFELLKDHIDHHDAIAETVWPSFVALQFDNQLTMEQAVSMLESAAEQKNIPALIELGLWYIQGTMVQKDRPHGMALWKKASSLGSREAHIRIAVADLMSSDDSVNARTSMPFLFDAMQEGSVLAQAAIGYCEEHGSGMPRNTGEAARLYRKSAERGSLIGYEALKRMYDALRPKGKEFRIDE